MTEVNLDFLAHQVGRVLDENRAIRREMRELRDGNVNLGRLIEHVREGVIIAMKTELSALLAGFEARLESRIADAIENARKGNGPRA